MKTDLFRQRELKGNTRRCEEPDKGTQSIQANSVIKNWMEYKITAMFLKQVNSF